MTTIFINWIEKQNEQKVTCFCKTNFCNFFIFSFLGELCETVPPLLHENTTCISPIKEITDTTCYFFARRDLKIMVQLAGRVRLITSGMEPLLNLKVSCYFQSRSFISGGINSNFNIPSYSALTGYQNVK